MNDPTVAGGRAADTQSQKRGGGARQVYPRAEEPREEERKASDPKDEDQYRSQGQKIDRRAMDPTRSPGEVPTNRSIARMSR
jgi:hypothetical protein